MTSGPRWSIRTGLFRPREHCTFTWTLDAEDEQRTVLVRSDHCEQCIAELRRRGYRLKAENRESPDDA
jgi:hypothetical protein